MTRPAPRQNIATHNATDMSIKSTAAIDTTYDIRGVAYAVHTKRGAAPDDPKTMRVTYTIGPGRQQYEYICFEHTGYARLKSIDWWQARSADPVPDTAAEAVELARGGRIKTTLAITVRSSPQERFDRIIGYKLGPVVLIEDPETDDATPEDAYWGDESLSNDGTSE